MAQSKAEPTRYQNYCQLIANCVDSSALGQVLPNGISQIIAELSFPINFGGIYVNDDNYYMLRFYPNGMALSVCIAKDETSLIAKVSIIKQVLRWFHNGNKQCRFETNQWYLPLFDKINTNNNDNYYNIISCNECNKHLKLDIGINNIKYNFINITVNGFTAHNTSMHLCSNIPCIIKDLETQNENENSKTENEYCDDFCIRTRFHATQNTVLDPCWTPHDYHLYQYYNISIDQTEHKI